MFSLKNIFRKHKVVVLMYHRIADVPVDPWDLAVSKENFEQQLEVIREQVIPLQELVAQLKEGRLTKSGYCITFDDGYTDNYLNAKPTLERYDCPATFFIASGFTGTNEMFWWDVLTQMFLETRELPGSLRIVIGKEELSFELENGGRLSDADMAKHKFWRWPAPAPTQRSEIYLRVWQAIRDLPGDEIRQVIERLSMWSGFEPADGAEHLPMNEDQLKSMAASAGFTFGVHAVSHPALGSHPIDHQRSELLTCRDRLAGEYKNYVNAVAYPYGHYNADTTAVMKQEKFDAGFTTQERPVLSASNKYELGRIKVANLPGKEFQKLLRSWYPN